MGGESMKQWVNGEFIDIPENNELTTEQDEPIVFENKQKLNEYIENFIVEFLTEGDGNDNGSN